MIYTETFNTNHLYYSILGLNGKGFALLPMKLSVIESNLYARHKYQTFSMTGSWYSILVCPLQVAEQRESTRNQTKTFPVTNRTFHYKKFTCNREMKLRKFIFLGSFCLKELKRCSMNIVCWTSVDIKIVKELRDGSSTRIDPFNFIKGFSFYPSADFLV